MLKARLCGLLSGVWGVKLSGSANPKRDCSLQPKGYAGVLVAVLANAAGFQNYEAAARAQMQLHKNMRY